jgi:segregation and condensation protein A
VEPSDGPAPSEAGRARGTLHYAPYTVRLPGFEGPLDLLLHLIKSRSLLQRQQRQRDEEDDDPLDDAEELRRRLLEYKLAKEIAAALRARELAGLQSFARPGRLVNPDVVLEWAPPQLVGLDARALAAVFKRVLLEKRLAEPEPLPLPAVTVAQKIAELEAALAEHGELLFEDFLSACTFRLAMVVAFLAVLELWHHGRLLVRQSDLFGPIKILPGPKFQQTHPTVSERGT